MTRPTVSPNPRLLAALAVEKAMISLAEFGELTGLGQTTVKKLVREGAIVSCKVGDRRLIPTSAVREFVDRLVAEATAERELAGA